MPQGSILGPLLFLLYINDMAACSRKLSFIHFADDTKAVEEGDNLQDLCVVVNRELALMDKWLRCNRLSLNVSKTSYMIISNKNRIIDNSVKIDDTPLSLTKQAKFLGIFIDDRLSFDDHLNHVCKKVSRSVGVLRKVSELVPRSVLRTMYLSLVYPFITYGIEAWGASCKTRLTRLRVLQNRCVRLLSPTDVLTSQITYSELHLLPIQHVHELFVLVKFYKYFVLGESLTYFNEIMKNIPAHNHLTRFHSNYKINTPDIKVSRYYSSFLYQGIRLWNNLSNEMRNTTSIHVFKTNLRKQILINNSSIQS